MAGSPSKPGLICWSCAVGSNSPPPMPDRTRHGDSGAKLGDCGIAAGVEVRPAEVLHHQGRQGQRPAEGVVAAPAEVLGDGSNPEVVHAVVEEGRPGPGERRAACGGAGIRKPSTGLGTMLWLTIRRSTASWPFSLSSDSSRKPEITRSSAQRLDDQLDSRSGRTPRRSPSG